MTAKEEEYLDYLKLARKEETATSYKSYLNAVSKYLRIDISPENLPDLTAANKLVKELSKTSIKKSYGQNCQAALRAYAAFVNHDKIKTITFSEKSGFQKNAIQDIEDVPNGNEAPDRASTVTSNVIRDQKVRDFVIKLANGKCEYCGKEGFITSNGRHYTEAHHIILLSKDGKDTVDNVIALCPDHHREAHYGKDAENLENEFIAIVKKREIN